MVYARILIPFVATSDRFGQWNPRAESWDVRFTRDILKDVPGSGFYDVLTGQNALEFGMKLALVFAEVAIGERSGLAGALFGFAAEEFESESQEKDERIESLEETVKALKTELEAVKFALDANSRTIAALLNGHVAENATAKSAGEYGLATASVSNLTRVRHCRT